MPTRMTIRPEDETRDRNIAQDHLAPGPRQAGEIHKALTDARRNRFASDTPVKRFFEGWRLCAGRVP